MKTTTKTITPDRKILSIGNISNTNICSEEKIADTIIDSFNEQVCLSNQFKQKTRSMIDSIEFAYTNDAVELQKTIDLFLESSYKLLREDMKNVFDLCTVLKSEATDKHNSHNQVTPINEEVNSVQNNYWMEDWIEQIDYFKKQS